MQLVYPFRFVFKSWTQSLKIDIADLFKGELNQSEGMNTDKEELLSVFESMKALFVDHVESTPLMNLCSMDDLQEFRWHGVRLLSRKRFIVANGDDPSDSDHYHVDTIVKFHPTNLCMVQMVLCCLSQEEGRGYETVGSIQAKISKDMIESFDNMVLADSPLFIDVMLDALNKDHDRVMESEVTFNRFGDVTQIADRNMVMEDLSNIVQRLFTSGRSNPASEKLALMFNKFTRVLTQYGD